MKGDHQGIWTNPEYVTCLERWWAEGLSCTRIVREFEILGVDLTKNSVIGKVHRMKFKRRGEAPHIVSPREKTINPKQKRVPYSRRVIRPKYIYGDVPMTVNPNPAKRILLKDIKDGKCRAIVGYLNGVMADAICCGEDAPVIIVRGRVTHSSWCQHHHDKYTIKDRYGSSSRNA